LEEHTTCVFCLKGFCSYEDHRLNKYSWDQIREFTKSDPDSWKDFFTKEHSKFFKLDTVRKTPGAPKASAKRTVVKKEVAKKEDTIKMEVKKEEIKATPVFVSKARKFDWYESQISEMKKADAEKTTVADMAFGETAKPLSDTDDTESKLDEETPRVPKPEKAAKEVVKPRKAAPKPAKAALLEVPKSKPSVTVTETKSVRFGESTLKKDFNIKDKAIFKKQKEQFKGLKKELASGGKSVDLLLIMDCTASMGSWINQAKNNLTKIIEKVQRTVTTQSFRVGYIGYRDFGDRGEDEEHYDI